MFVSQAHSFSQQARLAITLAWVAGYTNLVTLLACGHVTSHVSGTTSDFGHAVAEGRLAVAFYGAFLLVTFFAGAAISGVTTELGHRRGWNSIYVLPMAIEALFLAIVALVIAMRGPALDPADPILHWLTGLASAAMGLQNATITRISSGVVRTTHVTGVLTDLGTESVQFLWWLADRRRLARTGEGRVPLRALLHSLHAHPTGRRLALLASILGSFAFGAGLGTLAFDRIPTLAMVPPVLFLAWIIVQDIRVPIAEIEPWETLDGQRLDLPPSIALFRLRDDGGAAGSQRMPDLIAWSERLPRDAAVVVLDLGAGAVLDANAALALKATIERLQRDGRELVVAGIGAAALERLRRDGLDVLRGDHVASDVELAIAIALSLAPPARP